MTENPALLKKRLNVDVYDGQKAITIKQGSHSESIIWAILGLVCIFEGATYLYSGGIFGAVGLPVANIAKFYGWLFLAVLCSLFVLWNAVAYEVITTKKCHLLVEIRIGLHRRLFGKTYLITDIKNPRLECIRSKSGKNWRICFDYSGKIRRLETRCYSLEDGNHFLSDYLKPMLAV